MTTTTIHYLGSPYANLTACGRYSDSQSTVTTTDTVADVTCRTCRRVLSV